MHDEVAPFIVMVVGIIAFTAYKTVKLIFESLFKQRGEKTHPAYTVLLERRVKELEHRVTTLQDLVIGGEYDIRRKLESRPQETSADPHYAPSAAQQPTYANLNIFQD